MTPSTTWTKAFAGSQLDLTGYNLTFADEFNSLSVSTGAAKAAWYSAVHSPFGKAAFVNPGSAVDPFSVSDGILNIHMQNVGGRWQSGLLQSVNANGQGFSQSYGYFEMKAAYTGGEGAWAGMWLISDANRTNPSQPRVELDTIEAYGGDPDGYHTAIHYTPGTDTPNIAGKIAASSYTDLPGSMYDGKFHIYGTKITPDWIVTYYDGAEIARTQASEYTRSPFYMIFNLAMQDTGTKNPAATFDMKVDYIHVYANPTAVQAALHITDGADTVNGTDSNDILDGGKGADLLIGGLGSDTYYVDAGDRVVEKAGQGNDLVYSAVSFDMSGQAIENLTLTGAGDLNGTGNELNNVITGNGGNNILKGGAGADTLVGGGGNDTYYVDNAKDVIVETGDGKDVVHSSVSFDTTGLRVAEVILDGQDNVSAIGNGLANVLTGNSGDNLLDGRGGADTMSGGAGNDTYYVDNALDKIIEALNGGLDTIRSSISYKLLGSNVETLQLTGTANINATGSAAAEALYGNDGNNSIDGGAGADTMAGGKGNDVYMVDNVADQIVEKADEGKDTIYSSVSYKMTDNIEAMNLTGAVNLSGTGSSTNNIINGNDGNNRLDGGAGDDILSGRLGSDTLVGGSGSDVFLFTDTPSRTNIDHIVDFAPGADTINILSSQFSRSAGLLGALADNGFEVGTQATLATTRIVYNPVSGILYFDSDGRGGAAASPFAIVDNSAHLSAHDFIFV